jgi:hypothetical protein
MRCLPATLAAFCWAVSLSAFAGRVPQMPMPVEFRNSAEYRWLKKPVLDARVLDDMSDPSSWRLRGQGDIVFQTGAGILCERSLRVDVNVHDQQPAPEGRSNTRVALVRHFEGVDWRKYNRISFWIRPEMSGFNVFPFVVAFRNERDETVRYNWEDNHYVTLPVGEWNQVVWEITPLARDRVNSLEFHYWVNKRIPDPSDAVSFELAKLELQRVEPDHFEGWGVGPGAISFSHTGYQLGSSKTAIASSLEAAEFSLVREETGQTVLRKPVRTVKTRVGEFQELNFSEVGTPGSYMIRAGDLSTRPFRIDQNVWRETIWKSINFFYGERCGIEIPGIHDACHRDWQAVLGDKTMIMNGGWHDAGDLSQGAVNTAEATYAMFALAERLQTRGEDPILLKRLIEEANWGLDWLIKVRFPGGYRIGFSGMNIWTDGIIGNADDRRREALNNPNVNYLAASAGAMAYIVLKERDRDKAVRALRMAEEDWEHAIVGEETPETQSTPAFAATEMELASVGILASLELFRATGKRRYADKAQELAMLVVDSQQRSYVGKEFPLAGFFYTSPAKTDIFHQFHRGNDQAPIVAMARLCEAFPEHPDWIQWYAAVALYSEYQKRIAGTTDPYGVLPAYVYRENDYLRIVEGDRYQSNRDLYRKQVLEGMPLGDGYYLRAFPVWFQRRGNYGVLLSQAKGLSEAAHLRGDWAAADLAQRQLQWVVGRNPFVQSTMWGEGYDFAQQYSVSSGDIVGSLPVGVMTRGNRDVPYWPSQNTYVFKEVWVHPSARWFWLMRDLSGPAFVEGRLPPGSGATVTFEHQISGETYSVDSDFARGSFSAFLPEGRYRVRWEGHQTEIALLPGGTHTIEFGPGHFVLFKLQAETTGDENIKLRLKAEGVGRHRFTVRTYNLAPAQSAQEVDLAAGEVVELTWPVRIESATAPWVAVVIPNGDVSQRRELYGSPADR